MTTANVINNNPPNGNLFFSRDFTSAEILGAFATPVQFMPRPGAGLTYVGIQKQLIYFFGGIAYTGGGGPQLQFETNTGSANYSFNVGAVTGLVNYSQVVGLTYVGASTNEAISYTNTTQAFLNGNGTLRINFWYQLVEVG